MDRDAGVAHRRPELPACTADLLANSQALANVTAVEEDSIVIMPADTYVNEGIEPYTTFFQPVRRRARGQEQ